MSLYSFFTWLLLTLSGSSVLWFIAYEFGTLTTVAYVLILVISSLNALFVVGLMATMK